MHKVIIALASNHEQLDNMAEARRRLSRLLVAARYTPALWTEPIGHSTSPMYLNQLAEALTDLTATELVCRLKDIELAMHRTELDRQQQVVRIDLDLMRYDSERYHEKDWQRPYIRQLLPYVTMREDR